VPLETAGTEIQCPRCGILNDIPKLGDLEQLGPDGTYRVSAAPAIDPQQLQEMIQAFGKHKTDEAGRPIDLRHRSHFAEGGGPIPLAEEATQPQPVKPRYDPESGELIQPLELQPAPELTPAPVPLAKPVLQYARESNAPARIGAVGPLRALFHPVNLTVMIFVFLIHVFTNVIFAFPLKGVIFLVLPFVVGGALGVIAHYGNVIEEIGTEERDELPLFLRDLNISEDIWRPLVNMMVALVLCFGPPIAIVLSPIPPSARLRIALGLAALGIFLFPAVVLTSTTSGTILNLRPDRPWRMIGVLGARYFLLVALFVGSVFVYGLGLLATLGNTIAVFNLMKRTALIYHAIVAYPLLIAGIFLMHYFCWTLGLVYRAWHNEFPWVLQYYHATPPLLPSAPPPKVTADSPVHRSYTDYRRG
jgi:hypothetical protein